MVPDAAAARSRSLPADKAYHSLLTRILARRLRGLVAQSDY